jgi:cation diffusion facilitator CzcD-associated flavoprotein CzcO
MGAQLKRNLGLDDYVIYERSPDFGGTWWANVCEWYRLDAYICD